MQPMRSHIMKSIGPPFFSYGQSWVFSFKLCLICFGKCRPPFTCVGGSKGRNSTLQNGTLYFLHRCIFFFFLGEWWANQIGSMQKENWTWEAPHLINANHNRCKNVPPVSWDFSLKASHSRSPIFLENWAVPNRNCPSLQFIHES
jgi:hypothetical protein